MTPTELQTLKEKFANCLNDTEPTWPWAVFVRESVPALIAAAEELERVRDAATKLRKIQRQRDKDEDEYCAAGQTYGIDELAQAEIELDDILTSTQEKP